MIYLQKLSLTTNLYDMKKVLLTLAFGLFFVAFSNAQEKTEAVAVKTETTKKACTAKKACCASKAVAGADKSVEGNAGKATKACSKSKTECSAKAKKECKASKAVSGSEKSSEGNPGKATKACSKSKASCSKTKKTCTKKA